MFDKPGEYARILNLKAKPAKKKKRKTIDTINTRELPSGATQHPCRAFFLGVVAKPRHGEPGHLERRQSRRLWDSLEDGNSRWDGDGDSDGIAVY